MSAVEVVKMGSTPGQFAVWHGDDIAGYLFNYEPDVWRAQTSRTPEPGGPFPSQAAAVKWLVDLEPRS